MTEVVTGLHMLYALLHFHRIRVRLSWIVTVVSRKGSVPIMQYYTNAGANPFPNIINCSALSWFWLTWVNGNLTFGMGKHVGQNYLFNYNDPAPINVNYMGVASGTAGVSAQWFFPDVLFTNGMEVIALIKP